MIIEISYMFFPQFWGRGFAKEAVIASIDYVFRRLKVDPIIAITQEANLKSCHLGGGVANVWNKPHEEALFYQGYGKTDINKRLLTYYRHERIVEDIAVYGYELLLCSEGVRIDQ